MDEWRARRKIAGKRQMSVIGDADSDWGLLTGVSSVALGAVGFLWRLVHKFEKLSASMDWEKAELATVKAEHERATSKLSERMAELFEEHCRFREDAAALPTRGDLRDMEIRLNERIEALGTRVDLLCDRFG
jgi:hypothetical protein